MNLANSNVIVKLEEKAILLRDGANTVSLAHCETKEALDLVATALCLAQSAMKGERLSSHMESMEINGG